MNRLTALLARGRPTRGLWQTLPGATAAEIAGDAGFDWLVLDGEHGPWDPKGLRARLIAARATPCLLRVPAAEPWLLKQALDLGPDGVLVPMVHSAEAARAAVAACRYPPEGTRGHGAFVSRAGAFGTRPHDPAPSVWVQAESRDALDDLEGICAVPGVDCVFLGPADLSADLGTTPDAIGDVLADAIGRIRAAGTAAGIYAADPERWVGAGASAVSLGCDAVVLSHGLRDLRP